MIGYFFYHCNCNTHVIRRATKNSYPHLTFNVTIVSKFNFLIYNESGLYAFRNYAT